MQIARRGVFPPPPSDISATQGHVVPTARAWHDGAFYVGELSLYPIVAGAANVLRITMRGEVEVAATGFSDITGLTFGAHGEMYVFESTTGNPFPTPNTGDIVLVPARGLHDVCTVAYPTNSSANPATPGESVALTADTGPVYLTPTASAGGPYDAIAGLTILLDGSKSFDPNGLSLTYAWDLAGTGLFNSSNSISPSFYVGLTTPAGTDFSVCLKVSDVYKTSSASCSVVEVVAPITSPLEPSETPEPATLNLVALALAGLAGSRLPNRSHRAAPAKR